jgi:hypothetical protein
VFNERNGNFSPDFDHSRQEIRFGDLKPSVKSNWERDTSVPVKDVERRQVGLLECHFDLLLGNFPNIYTE